MKTRFFAMLFVFILPLALSSAAYSGTAILSWQPNAEPDLNGYNVYYGTASRSYKPAIPVGNVHSYEITNLDANTTYYFAVTALDTAGNESGFSKEVQKFIAASPPADTARPTVAITQPTSSGGYACNVARIPLAGTAADNVGVTRVSWNNSTGGSGVATGTATWSVASIDLKTGANVLTVTAVDAAGNSGTTALTVTYTPPDTTAPAVTITTPTTAPTYSTASDKINLAGTASDNTALKQVTWQSSAGANGVASGTANWSVSAIALNAGVNQITVTATDTAGNQKTAALSVTYTPPDTAAPSITITSPTTATTYTTESDTISLAGTASDNTALKQVTWQSSAGANGVASGTANWSVSAIALNTGNNTVTVTATDTAGNNASKSLTITRNAPEPPQPPPAGGLITDLAVASGKKYVFAGGLNVNSRAYIDDAVAYERVPDSLNGARYFQTAQADGGNTDTDFMRFNVTEDVYVFVAYDMRSPSKPQWLGAFSPARLYLRMKNRQLMQLHSKEYSAGQTVVLGGNGGGNMYTVVVVPKDEMPDFQQTGPRSIIIGPQ